MKLFRVSILTVLLSGAGAFTASGANGIAVSIAYRQSERNQYLPDTAASRLVPERNTYDKTFWGLLVRYDIRDNKTVRSDTLLDYLALFPAISNDGKKVAFFLKGHRLTKDGRLQKDVIAPGIYTCALDGTGLTKALDYSGFGKGNAIQLDWPLGNWIYYHNLSKSEGEIWRVNITTGANEFVVDYIPAAATTPSSDLRRWSCNAAATYDITHISGAGSYDSKNAHCFPSTSFLQCKSGPIKDCNLSMSASGNYCASYYGTGHPFVDISYWNFTPGISEHKKRITVSQAADMANVDTVGRDGEWIHWSCNSDKWVLQQIGWYGHADRISTAGSNAVYINWVDNQAIMLTNNTSNPDLGEKTISHCNTAGDFWVEGIDAGYYENIDSKQISITTRQVNTIAPAQGIPGAVSGIRPAMTLTTRGIIVDHDRQRFYTQQGRGMHGARRTNNFTRLHLEMQR